MVGDSRSDPKTVWKAKTQNIERKEKVVETVEAGIVEDVTGS